MSDDLDDLKRMMDAATPRPDAARRAESIALAQKNFADLQGSREEARLMSSAPKRGFWTGVRQMLTTLTSRGALTASTAIVAVGIVMLVPFDGSVLDNVRSRGAPEEKLAVAPKAPVTPEAPVVIAEEPMAADKAESAPLAGSAPQARDMATVESYESAAPPPPSIVAPAAPQAEMAPTMGLTAGRVAGDIVVQPQLPDTEAFANADANPVKVVSEEPVSTFFIDVDTASYAVVRNSLTNGYLPPADAVRVEEMVNYFPYDYPAPEGDAAFLPTVQVTATPWNPDTRLVQIGIQGALPALEDRPPLNLVFLIDTSGSMEDPAKLPLLKQSFRLMLGKLRPEDQVAIVTYAGSAGRVLDPTPAGERSTILAALDALGAGGSTAGQAGLQQAYATAAEMAQEGEVSRVILATDGDFNVGLSDPEALKDYIAAQRDSGTYLSVLGFGRGNLDDATMQALAQNGNGQAAYIDTLGEAQKVLVDQLGGALFPIADDVKIQVEFNPGQVAEYRLIGYETRALRREDFNNDKVDAGDIGAGHQVTALYEVTPVGSPAVLNDPLRYGDATSVAAPDDSSELGFLRLRYKTPGEDASTLIETPITATSGTAEAGFAAAMAGFGQLLRGSVYLNDWSWDEAIALANRTKGEDPFGYRAEAVQLMRLAQSLSAN